MLEITRGRSLRLVMAALFLLAAAAALGLWLRAGQAAPAQPALYQLTIASNSGYVGTCPVTVAYRNGYFQQEGVAAHIQPHRTGKSALEAALSGKADLATTADIPIMLAAMQDAPVSVLATFFKTEHDHGIVARRDRGIQALADLKGKNIGVTRGTSGHFALDGFLNREHLARTDVHIVDLKPEQFAGALERGEVDAIATWEPFLDALLRPLGSNGAVFYGEDIYEIPYSLAGSRAYIAANPDLMRRVLRALARGVHACGSEPEQARAVLSSYLQVDTSAWQAQWPQYHFKLALDQGLILALEDESHWAIANGLAPARDIPNFLDYMYLDAMAEVAPAAVTIIH